MSTPTPPADDRSDLDLVRDAHAALSEARQQLDRASAADAGQYVWLGLRLARYLDDRDDDGDRP